MIFIYITFQDLGVANLVAKKLVEKRMAGSVDVMPMHSTRLEEEKVVEISGAAMIVKTIDKHIQGIEDVVREYYQDGIPCIASISLYRLNRDFKDWLISATG